MTIEVTQEDIDHGKRGDCFDCPIARAIQRATNALNVDVSAGQVHIRCEDWSASYRLPAQASSFIVAFDNGRPVFPFTFEL